MHSKIEKWKKIKKHAHEKDNKTVFTKYISSFLFRFVLFLFNKPAFLSQFIWEPNKSSTVWNYELKMDKML